MPKNPHAVALGRLGGKSGNGCAKARTHAQAVKAGKLGAAKRWGKKRISDTLTAKEYKRLDTFLNR